MNNLVRAEADMRPYQRRALQHILKTKQTALFVDMGLGKTVIALSAIAETKDFGITNKPALVVAPIKVCETVWRQEAKQWEHLKHLTFSLVRGNERQRAYALSKPADIYLINFEQLVWLHKYTRGDWSQFDSLYIDESSMFKDHKTKRFKALTRYGVRLPQDWKPYDWKRIVIMTGTPRPNTMMNLWPQIFILDRGDRLHAKFETFRGRYFHTAGRIANHVYKFDLNAGEDLPTPDYELKNAAPERIHERIADISIELDASEYGILPKVIPVPHTVDLPPALRDEYKRLERDALIELQENLVIAANGGVKTMMCWQYANGAMYSTDEMGRKIWQELHTVKLDYLDELLEQINSNALIVYNFNHDFERIKARHPDIVQLKGKNTERIVELWNKGAIRKLALHPKSGGHGLNLQHGGNHIIWFSMTWSSEQYDQTNARLARSGQKFAVSKHHIIMKGTTDELMEASLAEKGNGQRRFREALRKYQMANEMGMYIGDLFPIHDTAIRKPVMTLTDLDALLEGELI